jgi:hypothetical protein
MMFILCMLLAQPPKVWTNADLRQPVARTAHRVTPAQLDGLRARQYVYVPRYDGPYEYVVPYTPPAPRAPEPRVEQVIVWPSYGWPITTFPMYQPPMFFSYGGYR